MRSTVQTGMAYLASFNKNAPVRATPPLLFSLYHHLPCRLFTPSCCDVYPPGPPTHDKSRDVQTFLPGYSHLRQGNVRAIHPDFTGYAHRMGPSCRPTKSPMKLSNVERSMSFLIQSSSSDSTIPKITLSTLPTSSRTRLHTHRRTATRSFSPTNRTLDSPADKTWLAFVERKAGSAVLPHLSGTTEQRGPPKNNAK
jgi:hypothetical protein